MESESTSAHTPASTSPRPTLLTVLCILTFLSAGFGVFNAVTTYSSADVVAEAAQEGLDRAAERVDDAEASDFVDKIMGRVSANMTPENIRKSAVADGLYNLLALAGALLMFNLRKPGFYLYLAGIAVAIIAPFVIYGGLMGAAGAATTFFSIIFAVLYATQLRFMH